MVKYVDSGEGPVDDKKKKRMGFKVDRRENFEKMLRKKMGKKESKPTKPTRAKSVVFDQDALKDYVLSLHKNKNERRVKAFVDVKRKAKQDSAKVRREQREEARRAYNQYAKVPILPNYTFQLPQAVPEGSDGEEEEEEDVLDPLVRPLLAKRRAERNTTMKQQTTHCMPVSMLRTETEEKDANHDSMQVGGSKPHRTLSDFYEETDKSKSKRKAGREDRKTKRQLKDEGDGAGPPVVVEVQPLFPTGGSSSAERATVLPSVDFADLPTEVQLELRRLRQETRGPSRTPSRVHTLKELEKIRKIRRHSRKGHGKKSVSGKRKNRR